MNIPKRYQIFHKPVEVSPKDFERLSPHLSGWMPLAHLLLEGINESDLKRLIVMELLGKQRWKLLDRLLMRLGRAQRQQLETKVLTCLKPSKRPR